MRDVIREAVDVGALTPAAATDDGFALFTVWVSGVVSQQMANEPDASFDSGRFTRACSTASSTPTCSRSIPSTRAKGAGAMIETDITRARDVAPTDRVHALRLLGAETAAWNALLPTFAPTTGMRSDRVRPLVGARHRRSPRRPRRGDPAAVAVPAPRSFRSAAGTPSWRGSMRTWKRKSRRTVPADRRSAAALRRRLGPRDPAAGPSARARARPRYRDGHGGDALPHARRAFRRDLPARPLDAPRRRLPRDRTAPPHRNRTTPRSWRRSCASSTSTSGPVRASCSS